VVEVQVTEVGHQLGAIGIRRTVGERLTEEPLKILEISETTERLRKKTPPLMTRLAGRIEL
jgi:hypothetical protein